jgi:hypothetical protein
LVERLRRHALVLLCKAVLVQMAAGASNSALFGWALLVWGSK